MTSQRKTIAPGTLDAYPVLPLRDIVVFPHMIVPLFVGREKSIRALEEVMKSDKPILLATQKNAADDDPGPKPRRWPTSRSRRSRRRRCRARSCPSSRAT
jgi:ATP-dependent Lon protease